MSRQSLDMRYGRRGGRIVPWRPIPKPGEPQPAIVDATPDQDEGAESRGQLSLFDEGES